MSQQCFPSAETAPHTVLFSHTWSHLSGDESYVIGTIIPILH